MTVIEDMPFEKLGESWKHTLNKNKGEDMSRNEALLFYYAREELVNTCMSDETRGRLFGSSSSSGKVEIDAFAAVGSDHDQNVEKSSDNYYERLHDHYFFMGGIDCSIIKQPLPKYYTKEYRKEDLSKDVLYSWETTVAPHFKAVGFGFIIHEGKCEFILKRNDVESQPLIDRAKSVLRLLACGLSSLWVKPVLAKTFCCEEIRFAVRDLMGLEELEKLFTKYKALRQGFINHKLCAKWCCFVRFRVDRVVVLATTSTVVRAVSGLVNLTVSRDMPFADGVEFWNQRLYINNGEDMSRNARLLFTYARNELVKTRKSSVNLTGSKTITVGSRMELVETGGRHLDSSSSSGKVEVVGGATVGSEDRKKEPGFSSSSVQSLIASEDSGPLGVDAVASGITSQSLLEEGNNNLVRQQPSSTAIDVDSNSQADSMKAICCSFSDAETVPHTRSQASLNEGSELEVKSDGQHSDESDIFEAPSLMTLMEPRARNVAPRQKRAAGKVAEAAEAQRKRAKGSTVAGSSRETGFRQEGDDIIPSGFEDALRAMEVTERAFLLRTCELLQLGGLSRQTARPSAGQEERDNVMKNVLTGMFDLFKSDPGRLADELEAEKARLTKTTLTLEQVREEVKDKTRKLQTAAKLKIEADEKLKKAQEDRDVLAQELEKVRNDMSQLLEEARNAARQEAVEEFRNSEEQRTLLENAKSEGIALNFQEIASKGYIDWGKVQADKDAEARAEAERAIKAAEEQAEDEEEELGDDARDNAASPSAQA